MSPAISLLAHLGSDGGDLVRLMGSIDAQSLPYDAFEVTFLLDGADPATQRRLADLAARRPNVRVRIADDGTASLDAAVADARGEWLLYLAPGMLADGAHLRPRALERLLAASAAQDCDLVLARVDAGGNVNDLFAATPGGPPPASALLPPLAAVYRLGFAVGNGVARDASSARSLMEAAQHVAVCGDYPCIALPDARVTAAGDTVAIADVSADWQEGALLVSLRGSTQGGGEVRFALRERDGEQFWLPGSTAVPPHGSFTATTAVDVRTAALGSPLRPGVWALAVAAHQPGDRWTAQSPVPAVRIRPALVEGTLVARARRKALALDVAATSHSAVPPFALADVAVADTAAGVTMTVQLPEMHVHGDSVVEGSVLLGTFPLRARIVAEDGAARLSCLLSGLAGTSTLSTKFGESPAAVTGLSLEISATGDMQVIPPPPRRPAAAAATASAARAPDRRPPAPNTSLAARLRRHVPAALEPAVRALAGNERARRFYRRLSGRSAGGGRHSARR